DVFALDDDAAPAERRYAAAELESARGEGYEAGARDAAVREEAAQTALLETIAAALGDRRNDYEAALAAHRQSLNAAAAAILKRFCEKLAHAREIEIAEDLVDRIAGGEPDGAPATLRLNPESLSRLRATLTKTLKARGLETFIALAADSALQPGEARIDWRGGAASRRLDTAFREIDAIIESAAPSGARTPGNHASNATPDSDTESFS
ncbi:MAG: hypothetical protein ACE5FO_11105, partial [Parvularculaceae bacterium]